MHPLLFFFFFNDTATTEIYTLSLHDALPIWRPVASGRLTASATCPPSGTPSAHAGSSMAGRRCSRNPRDRKSTRLNSSHGYISYAVFCLKKKKVYKDEQVLVLDITSKRDVSV